MKANELIIGDFVRVAKDVCFKKGTIVKIHGIDAEHVFSEKGLKGVASCMPANDPSECTSGVWVEYLEPIQLTPEVLEKNGFEFLIDTWYLQTEERKPIHIRFMDGFIAISINCNIIPMGLKYVHQLQHALKLCEIEKEIIL